jgi:hypothetical protein
VIGSISHLPRPCIPFAGLRFPIRLDDKPDCARFGQYSGLIIPNASTAIDERNSFGLPPEDVQLLISSRKNMVKGITKNAKQRV